MKTLALIAVTALAPIPLVIAQAPPAQKSVPLPAPAAKAAQVAPSAEALAWSQKNLASWPEAARRLGAQLVTRYGQPAEVTSRQITWHDNAPWKRTTLHKDGPQHNFAAPHKDVLEQVINYKVPADKIGALAQFNGSIVANITAGELASRSDSEELNFLGLNVADAVVKGERTPEEARTYYAQIVRAKMIKEPEADLQRLRFTPEKTNTQTASPDEVAPLIKHMSNADGSMK